MHGSHLLPMIARSLISGQAVSERACARLVPASRIVGERGSMLIHAALQAISAACSVLGRALCGGRHAMHICGG